MYNRPELDDLIPFNYIDWIGRQALNLPPLRQVLPPSPARILNDLGIPTLENMPTPGDIYTSIPKPQHFLPNIPLPPPPPLPFLNIPLPKHAPVGY